MPTFEGRTVDAEAPFLEAEFWQEGTTIKGIVSKVFETNQQKGNESVKAKCYVLLLSDPVEINGEEWDRCSIGTLAGFKMAMEAARIPSLQLKDVVTLTCEGKKKAKKEGYNDRINFAIHVVRP